MLNQDILKNNMDHGSENSMGVLSWITGLMCFAVSHFEPSEVRAWIAFTLGCIASLISIAINWGKFKALFERKPKPKKKK
jgi:hypothetical protein